MQPVMWDFFYAPIYLRLQGHFSVIGSHEPSMHRHADVNSVYALAFSAR